VSHAYCIMTKEKDIYNTKVSDILTDLDNSPLSTKQLRQKVAEAIAFLESQGIRDWEILEAWSDIMWKAGNREATKALEKASQEVKKCERW
jgi:hypothetical protein